MTYISIYPTYSIYIFFCDKKNFYLYPYLRSSTIFQVRGTVTAIVIATACGLVSIQLRVFQPIAASVGLYFIFWLFAAVCLLSTVYIALVVPETKMKTLDEIYAEIGGKKTKSKEIDCEADVTKL